MKKILWMVALGLMLVGTAHAEDKGKAYLAIRPSSEPNSCAWFKGSFTADGRVGVQEDFKPIVTCELVENVGATCYIKGYTLTKTVDQFKGGFQIDETGNGLLVSVERDIFRAQVLCDKTHGCAIFRVWNKNNNYGFACIMEPIPDKDKPTAKPQKPTKPVLPPTTDNSTAI